VFERNWQRALEFTSIRAAVSSPEVVPDMHLMIKRLLKEGLTDSAIAKWIGARCSPVPTIGLGRVGAAAAILRSLITPSWPASDRDTVLPNGVDLTSFLSIGCVSRKRR
jgi:hypothetical protein